MKNFIVQTKNLSFSYSNGVRKVPVLNDVSLEIPQGAMVAIRGPSGSGKSTLLYLLGCLLQQDEGQILINGQDLSQLSDLQSAELRNRKIGFVFQHFHLLARTTVLENILLPTMYPTERPLRTKETKNKALKLAKYLGLEEHLNHLPNQLSGGQQQRVAIARALINDADLILADEPTGNLDSETSKQIMDLFKDLHNQGKTIIIITHEQEVADYCPTVLHLKDGRFLEEQSPKATAPQGPPASPEKKEETKRPGILGLWALARQLTPLAFANLMSHKARSLLTMLGIIIGVAAVLAMITLGQFTQEKVMASYAELGANTFIFRGHRNWELKATDQVSTMFQEFNWEKDLLPLKKIFPQIKRLSPLMMNWGTKGSYGGKSIDDELRVIGINEEGLAAGARNIILGKGISPYHVANRSNVCVIGFEIAQRLFSNTSPLGQILMLNENEEIYGCRIIGVLESKTSNKEWLKPNFQVFLPFGFFQAVTKQWWDSLIQTATIQLNEGADVEKTGEGIRRFFERKYGKSGRFRVSADSVLIAQMERFLNLFTVMLGTIAFIALAVGGIGITNMMLVSVSERFKEIGLRKALGATGKSIKLQLLSESVLICGAAGVIGLIVGFIAYQAAIFAATKFVKDLQFEFIFDPWAILISAGSILLVGVLSGLVPAYKAEKLQVIEALRSE